MFGSVFLAPTFRVIFQDESDAFNKTQGMVYCVDASVSDERREDLREEITNSLTRMWTERMPNAGSNSRETLRTLGLDDLDWNEPNRANREPNTGREINWIGRPSPDDEEQGARIFGMHGLNGEHVPALSFAATYLATLPKVLLHNLNTGFVVPEDVLREVLQARARALLTGLSREAGRTSYTLSGLGIAEVPTVRNEVMQLCLCLYPWTFDQLDPNVSALIRIIVFRTDGKLTVDYSIPDNYWKSFQAIFPDLTFDEVSS